MTFFMKKILVLYIANGGQWEESFEDFFFWSFDYSMWCKMNLFYAKARDAFGEESIFSEVSTTSPLEMVGDLFTREDIKNAIIKGGFKSNAANYISTLKRRGNIVQLEKDIFRKKSVSQSVKKYEYIRKACSPIMSYTLFL